LYSKPLISMPGMSGSTELIPQLSAVEAAFPVVP
jgi:hypothetical protein